MIEAISYTAFVFVIGFLFGRNTLNPQVKVTICDNAMIAIYEYVKSIREK